MTAITDGGAPSTSDFFQSSTSVRSAIGNFHIPVESGKAHLDFLWAFTSDFSGGPANEYGHLVQVAGSLLSFLLFAILWSLVKENERILEKVQQRTIELSAAVEKSKREIEEKNNAEQALKAMTVRLIALSDASFEAIIFSPAQLEIVKTMLQTEAETPYEVIASRKDGSTLPVLVQGRTIDYLGKKIRVTAMSDITDRKNAEAEREKLAEQLYQAKKMESLGLMAGGVAHDLNNILSGIIGYPELLLRTLSKDSELRKPIEAIRDSGQRAVTVVADLLTVARGVAPVLRTRI